MEFIQKKKAYDKLLGEQHFAADAKLLKGRNPNSPLLIGEMVDKKQGQSDVLWELLDLSTEEEILANRGEKPEPKKEVKAKPENKTPVAKKKAPQKKTTKPRKNPKAARKK